jgi:alanine racemase
MWEADCVTCVRRRLAPRASDGPFAAYCGVRLPFVGWVSMDSITIDASVLPPNALAAGSLVDPQTVDHVARYAGTIGYEILTGLGSRFHRNYIGG